MANDPTGHGGSGPPEPETDAEPPPYPGGDLAATDPEPSVVIRLPPPYAFLKGAVLGIVLFLPLTALAVLLLGHIGAVDPGVEYAQIMAYAAVFAGFPAVLTAGGIGRAAARAAVVPGRRRSRLLVAAAAHGAVTGAGLVVLTLVPLGHVPAGPEMWSWIAALGGVAGAAGGAGTGLWVSYGSRSSP